MILIRVANIIPVVHKWLLYSYTEIAGYGLLINRSTGNRWFAVTTGEIAHEWQGTLGRQLWNRRGRLRLHRDKAEAGWRMKKLIQIFTTYCIKNLMHNKGGLALLFSQKVSATLSVFLVFWVVPKFCPGEGVWKPGRIVVQNYWRQRIDLLSRSFALIFLTSFLRLISDVWGCTFWR